MAKGGSGDVLAGVIGALLGQLPSRRAVVTACWLHARAGDEATARYGEYAACASDIIEALPAAQRELMD
jgi:NAD(P)H-hydrate epimerase